MHTGSYDNHHHSFLNKDLPKLLITANPWSQNVRCYDEISMKYEARGYIPYISGNVNNIALTPWIDFLYQCCRVFEYISCLHFLSTSCPSWAHYQWLWVWHSFCYLFLWLWPQCPHIFYYKLSCVNFCEHILHLQNNIFQSHSQSSKMTPRAFITAAACAVLIFAVSCNGKILFYDSVASCLAFFIPKWIILESL